MSGVLGLLNKLCGSSGCFMFPIKHGYVSSNMRNNEELAKEEDGPARLYEFNWKMTVEPTAYVVDGLLKMSACSFQVTGSARIEGTSGCEAKQRMIEWLQSESADWSFEPTGKVYKLRQLSGQHGRNAPIGFCSPNTQAELYD